MDADDASTFLPDGRLLVTEKKDSLLAVTKDGQYPKLVGYGHYGHRLAFDDDGYLWLTSGDRQKVTPSQDMQSNVGEVLRLDDDGSVPDDSPGLCSARIAQHAGADFAPT